MPTKVGPYAGVQPDRKGDDRPKGERSVEGAYAGYKGGPNLNPPKMKDWVPEVDGTMDSSK